MAFRDIDVVMYGGDIKIEYKDKTHRYYRRDLQSDGTWSKTVPVRGTTTILGDTLEKKGLMTWPLGMALTELFGFYDFTNEEGRKLTGFSRDKGTFWGLENFDKETMLPVVQSAAKAWQRKQDQGANIGSLVHDAIEQYVNGSPFELTLDKYVEGKEFESADDKARWLTTAQQEVDMAVLAYGRFKTWWAETEPTLLGSEQIIYSREHHYCGSYDALLAIKPEHHPVYNDWARPIKVMCDWKTSKASVSAGAPMGVYYSYFIQDAAYAAALYEMTGELVDDLLVVSARKDGEFDTVYASELGLSVADCIDWWFAVIKCNDLMNKAKKGLVELDKNKPASADVPF